MKLNSVVKSVGSNGYKAGKAIGKGTLGILTFIAECSASEDPESIDISDLTSKGKNSQKAFILLDDYKYDSLKRDLCKKIIRSEENDRYATYCPWEEEQENLCKNAIIYVADMLDHGKMMYEIADNLGLQPSTVTEICRFFNKLEVEDEE